jgi:glutaminyl-peptide cyclotransferase
VPGTPEHIKCRDWIAEEMKKHCQNVHLQELSHTWSYTNKKITMWNVIGEQNWVNAKTRVLLLAHWDSRPYADQDLDTKNRAKPVTGANDGASGVAVLLELMRVLKDKNPDLGIMYLMTDGEDLGPELDEMFLGAKYFAANLPSPKPEYGILLDMVGTKNVKIPMESNSYGYAPELMKAFYLNARENGLGRTFPAQYGPAISDDHLCLNAAGLPTIDLIDFEHLDHWHTATDTPENCSADSLGNVGKAMDSWLSKSPPYRFKK